MPDLHLYDQEIGNSVGYAEESIKILKEVREEFIVGEYDLITLGGDIQHAKIQKIKYLSIFQKILSEIGMVCKERLISRGLLDKIKVYSETGELINIEDNLGTIFTVRGQHDSNSIEEFTFFDLLIDNGIIINPRYICIDDLQISFINYTKNWDELKEDKRENIKSLIGIYHNLIIDRGVYVEGFLGKSIIPSDLKIFKDTDLAIINDIHTYIPMYDVITDNKKTLVVTPGSLGRTSFIKGQDRDYGNLIKIEVDDNYDIKVGLIEVELTPSEVFFNKESLIKKKIIENAFKNFSMEIDNIEIPYFDVFEELDKLVKDEDIKEIGVNILRD